MYDLVLGLQIIAQIICTRELSPCIACHVEPATTDNVGNEFAVMRSIWGFVHLNGGTDD